MMVAKRRNEKRGEERINGEEGRPECERHPAY